MGTAEKLTLENMGVAFGILSLGGTETEIHLGDHSPPNCNVRFKKYHCNTRVNNIIHRFLLFFAFSSHIRNITVQNGKKK